MKTFTSLLIIPLLIFAANAVNLATNFGFCATYMKPKIGIPVTFIRCNPKSVKQTTWTVLPAGAGQPATAVLFCINSNDNLCIGVSPANGIAHLVKQNLADPAQQWTPVVPLATNKFTNGLAGSTNCAQVIAGLFAVKRCRPDSPFQQIFTFGPTARAFHYSDPDDFDLGTVELEETYEQTHPIFPFNYIYYLKN